MRLPVIRSRRFGICCFCGHPVSWELRKIRRSRVLVSTFSMAAWCTNFEKPQSFDTDQFSPLDSGDLMYQWLCGKYNRRHGKASISHIKTSLGSSWHVSQKISPSPKSHPEDAKPVRLLFKGRRCFEQPDSLKKCLNHGNSLSIDQANVLIWETWANKIQRCLSFGPSQA